MNKMPRLFNMVIVSLYLFFCIFVVWKKNSENTILDNIQKQGEITVITLNNAHCYYFYKDQPMGFEYDLAKAFAEYLGVKLNVQVEDNTDDLIPALKKNRQAFIAANMTISSKRKKEVAFSDGYMKVRQHVIVRKQSNKIMQNPKDLGGQNIHVRKGSDYEYRLKKLQKRGINLKIVSLENTYDEELIKKVAKNKIKITIALSNIAHIKRRYYPEIAVAAAISEPEYLGWAVDRNSITLLERVNDFFKTIKKNGKYTQILNKYYLGVDSFDHTDLVFFYFMMKTRFPSYSSTIKDASNKYGFDWRLITAMAYQESLFDPFAQSHAGAYGFMQITLETAISLGSTNIFDPEQNIYTGLRHLKNLHNYYRKVSEEDSMLIALAAYNIGEGHIADARDLALNKNMNPNNWASISKVLPLLSEHKYYSKATYGYCRGSEAVNYVNQVMNYYEILKKDAIKYKKKQHHTGKNPN